MGSFHSDCKIRVARLGRINLYLIKRGCHCYGKSSKKCHVYLSTACVKSTIGESVFVPAHTKPASIANPAIFRHLHLTAFHYRVIHPRPVPINLPKKPLIN